MWARKGSRSVHKVLPNEREWITNLTCVNAAGDHIPGFYIFQGKRLRSNYVIHCEDGVAMAMQTKAWMIATLFSHWISHFIRCLERKGDISHERRHLLILDGHNYHVTLEVVHKCREVGLDLLILPSHTSHRLQLLDVGVFVPFKHYFKRYRDAWSINNKGKGASKQTLAMWVSKALERALTTRNIIAGFCTTRIYLLNCKAVNAHMGPVRQFRYLHNTIQKGASLGGTVGFAGEGAIQTLSGKGIDTDRSYEDGDCRSDSDSSGSSDRVVHQLRGDLVLESQPMHVQHFYVGTTSADVAESDSDGSSSHYFVHTMVIAEDPGPLPVTPAIAALLALPEITVASSRKRAGSQEALVDYSRSLLITSEEYIAAIEEKSRRRKEARVQTHIRR